MVSAEMYKSVMHRTPIGAIGPYRDLCRSVTYQSLMSMTFVMCLRDLLSKFFLSVVYRGVCLLAFVKVWVPYFRFSSS